MSNLQKYVFISKDSSTYAKKFKGISLKRSIFKENYQTLGNLSIFFFLDVKIHDDHLTHYQFASFHDVIKLPPVETENVLS